MSFRPSFLSLFWCPLIITAIKWISNKQKAPQRNRGFTQSLQTKYAKEMSQVRPLPGTCRYCPCFPVALLSKFGLDRLTVEVSRSHTHTADRTPLDEWSDRRRGRYLKNTQQKSEKNPRPGGIRTRNPRKSGGSKSAPKTAQTPWSAQFHWLLTNNFEGCKYNRRQWRRLLTTMMMIMMIILKLKLTLYLPWRHEGGVEV
jgi:hypothetical protein